MQAGAAGRQQGQFQNLSNIGLNYSPYAYHEKQGTSGFFAPFMTGMAQGGFFNGGGGGGGGIPIPGG
jgi:hypothetical protein